MNKYRTVQLIKRDKLDHDLIVLTVAGPEVVERGFGPQGLTLAKGSMQGIYHAQRTSTAEIVASIPGSAPGLDRVEARTVTLVVEARGFQGHPFGDVDSLLWEVVAPGEFWVLRVEAMDGRTARELTLRRTLAPELVDGDTDPEEQGRAVWKIEAIAHDPWWYGPASTDKFTPTGSGIYVLKVENRGDQEAWPRFIIRQSTGDQTWTVPDGLGLYPSGHAQAGQRIKMPLPVVPAGLHGLADTHPLRLPFTLPDRPMAFGLLRQKRFTHAIPKRSGVVEMPVSVVAPSGGGIKVKVRPPYDRPWGW